MCLNSLLIIITIIYIFLRFLHLFGGSNIDCSLKEDVPYFMGRRFLPCRFQYYTVYLVVSLCSVSVGMDLVMESKLADHKVGANGDEPLPLHCECFSSFRTTMFLFVPAPQISYIYSLVYTLQYRCFVRLFVMFRYSASFMFQPIDLIFSQMFMFSASTYSMSSLRYQ